MSLHPPSRATPPSRISSPLVFPPEIIRLIFDEIVAEAREINWKTASGRQCRGDLAKLCLVSKGTLECARKALYGTLYLAADFREVLSVGCGSGGPSDEDSNDSEHNWIGYRNEEEYGHYEEEENSWYLKSLPQRAVETTEFYPLLVTLRAFPHLSSFVRSVEMD